MKALITGATSGIGKCIAENLSKKGWELILTGRNEKMLKKLQKKLGNTL
ncbi:MAG: SDR family NAD(P)-dependent oxidoreductase, partial [Ruminococcus sp.]|nr:SDR family NAD(P)-dependent oxidoreductase [Ruminococcus sp.]